MAYVHIDVDLDEFDSDDLKRELESRGYSVTKKGEPGLPFEAMTDLEHVRHLAQCGLVNDARLEALQMLSRHIGHRLN